MTWLAWLTYCALRTMLVTHLTLGWTWKRSARTAISNHKTLWDFERDWSGES